MLDRTHLGDQLAHEVDTPGVVRTQGHLLTVDGSSAAEISALAGS